MGRGVHPHTSRHWNNHGIMCMHVYNLTDQHWNVVLPVFTIINSTKAEPPNGLISLCQEIGTFNRVHVHILKELNETYGQIND